MASNIKKNFSYNIIYQFFTLAMPLITAPYISRILGPEGIGTYSFYYSIASYFIYFELLGINNYGVRNIAKCNSIEERKQKFWDIYHVQFAISLIIIAAYLGATLFIFQNNKAIAVVLIPYVVSGMLDINWYFFGTEQFSITTFRNCIIKTITIILIFAFVKDENDLLLYTFIMAFGYFLSQIIMWYNLLRQVPIRKWTKGTFKYHLQGLLVLFIPVIAISLYKIMDKIMLGVMSDMVQVGLYENAEKIAGVPSTITVALGTAMLPRMTNLVSNKDASKFEKYFELSILFSAGISLAMSAGLILVSDVFVPIYFGAKFVGATTILKVLSSTLIFSSFASVIRTQYLIPKEKDKIYITSVFVGAVVNIILNAIFIPRFGGVGAAIGTLCAEAAVAIYQAYSIRKNVRIIKYVVESSVFILPTFLMFFVTNYYNKLITTSPSLHLVILVVGGVVTYALFILPIIFGIERYKKRV